MSIQSRSLVSGFNSIPYDLPLSLSNTTDEENSFESIMRQI